MCEGRLPFRSDEEIINKQTPKLIKQFDDLNQLLNGYYYNGIFEILTTV